MLNSLASNPFDRVLVLEMVRVTKLLLSQSRSSWAAATNKRPTPRPLLQVVLNEMSCMLK